MGTLMKRLGENSLDAWRMGPGFLMRHAARLRGTTLAAPHIRGVGPVHIRRGNTDLDVLRQVFAERQYAFTDISPVTKRAKQWYREIIDAGNVPVVIDAGANIGAASLWFRSVWPRAAIVAIEPDPDNAHILRRNLGNKEKIVIFEGAIGSRAGSVNIVPGTSGWGAQTVQAESGIPMVTVQEALSFIPRGRLFIVKVDIEGFEQELFSGNISWLNDARIIFIEPHDWAFPGRRTSQTFQRAMAERDLEVFIAGENLVYTQVP